MTAESIEKAISGYVLAGGASSRLGRDKVLLPWEHGTLLDHAIARLQKVCATVNVCASRSDLRRHLLPNIEIIPDAIAGCGPLGGIVAALESSQTDWSLFLAVDLPLIPVEFLQWLIVYATDCRSPESPAFCILPCVDDMPQPLCGLYRRSLALGLRDALQEGKYKIMHALHHAEKHIARQGSLSIPVERGNTDAGRSDMSSSIKVLDLNGFDTLSHTNGLNSKDRFLNINTDADLLCARELIRVSSSDAR